MRWCNKAWGLGGKAERATQRIIHSSWLWSTEMFHWLTGISSLACLIFMEYCCSVFTEQWYTHTHTSTYCVCVRAQAHRADWPPCSQTAKKCSLSTTRRSCCKAIACAHTCKYSTHITKSQSFKSSLVLYSLLTFILRFLLPCVSPVGTVWRRSSRWWPAMVRAWKTCASPFRLLMRSRPGKLDHSPWGSGTEREEKESIFTLIRHHHMHLEEDYCKLRMHSCGPWEQCVWLMSQWKMITTQFIKYETIGVFFFCFSHDVN